MQTRDVPSLLLPLPLKAVKKSGWLKKYGTKVKRWKSNVFTKSILVVPMCEFVLFDNNSTCKCNNVHEGYVLKTPKNFVVRANRFLRVASTILEVVSFAGKIVGFPIPGVDIKELLGVPGAGSEFIDALGELGEESSSGAEAIDRIIVKIQRGEANAAEMSRLAESLCPEIEAVRSILETAQTEITQKTFKEDGGGLERVVLEESSTSGRYSLWLCSAHAKLAVDKQIAVRCKMQPPDSPATAEQGMTEPVVSSATPKSGCGPSISCSLM